MHRAAEDARLDGCAECHGFVGILRNVRLALKDRAHEVADQRHARLATHEDDLVEIGGRELRVVQRAQAVGARPFHDGPRDALQLRAGECADEALRAGEKRQFDPRLVLKGQPMLRRDQRLAQPRVRLGNQI